MRRVGPRRRATVVGRQPRRRGIPRPAWPVGTLVSPAARAQLNILDLVPVLDGGTAGEAIASTVDIARHAEKWGYQRYWMAEHHNMRGVASSSTAVLIGHVADQTETIRVGAGGIMLPNHAPYVVAEQFGTLATIHPGRIDLGLGRAPGTDPFTTRALRRNEAAAMNFAGEVEELIGYLGDPDPDAKVRAIPGEGTHVPIWILGSSHGGAAGRRRPRPALLLRLALRARRAHERARGLPVALHPVDRARRPRRAALDGRRQRHGRRHDRRGRAPLHERAPALPRHRHRAPRRPARAAGRHREPHGRRGRRPSARP